MGYTIHVLDNYYLAITFLCSLGIQFTAFIISYTLQFDKITDFSGAFNFFFIAILTLLLNVHHAIHARQIVASVLVMVWAVRLGGFLLFRVLKTGGDSRFDEMRSQFFKFAGFWTFQLIWVWTVSLPITILNSPKCNSRALGAGNPTFGSGTDIVGIIFWAIGFTIEAVSDVQKYRWKSSKPPKGTINNTGFFGWTRHPNYFGEIFLWWGIWLLVIEPARSKTVSYSARAALFGSVMSPVFITGLLLFLSGLPTAEKPTQEKYFLMQHGGDDRERNNKDEVQAHAWDNYKNYLNSTSIIFPLPPFLYRPMPSFLKRTVLLDFPFYQFDEKKEGEKALEDDRKKREQKERDQSHTGEA